MRLRHVLIAAVAAVTAVLLSSCDTGTPSPFAQPHYHGSPVPSASVDPVYPEPPEVTAPPFNPPVNVVALEMENALSNQIGRDVSMTPKCAKALTVKRKPNVVSCYARWGGVVVPFKVTLINDGHDYFTARTVQLEGLLVASAVRTAWAQFNYAIESRLSCSADMPQASLVPFGKPTKYLCAVGTSFDSVQVDHAETDGVNGSPFVFNPIA